MPQGSVIAFHNALWHRALPNHSPIPRTIAYHSAKHFSHSCHLSNQPTTSYVFGSRYFQYCHTMQHPLHRAVPYEGDLSSFTSEERWLLGEPRSPGSWVYGSPEDKVRMDRFRRQDPEADYYQRMLRQKQGEGERARLRERSGMQPL